MDLAMENYSTYMAMIDLVDKISINIEKTHNIGIFIDVHVYI